MKIPCSLLFISAAGLAIGAPVPLANPFNNSSMAAPPLTLADASAAVANSKDLPAVPRFTQGPANVLKPSVKGKITAASSMPVIRSDPAVDYKLMIKPADPSIDPKMLLDAGSTDQP